MRCISEAHCFTLGLREAFCLGSRVLLTRPGSCLVASVLLGAERYLGLPVLFPPDLEAVVAPGSTDFFP